jgi:hypothetical protein
MKSHPGMAFSMPLVQPHAQAKREERFMKPKKPPSIRKAVFEIIHVMDIVQPFFFWN